MRERQKKQISSFLEAVKAPEGGTCKICNEPLGATPYFVVNYPDGEHVSCWEKHLGQQSFPYELDLRELRLLARHLSTAYSELIDFGQWLRRMKAGWPKTRTQIQKEHRDRRARLRQAFAVLQCRLRV